MMKKMKLGILMVLAVLALVSVASATLPSGNLAVHANLINPNTNSYWGVDVTQGVNDELPIGLYDGWCTDTANDISTGLHYFTAYSSLDSGSFPLGMPSAQWDRVNYILNHPASDWMITQAAIWHFDGQSGEAYPHANGVWTWNGLNGYSKADYDAYVGAIPSGFSPTCREPYYAIILYDPGKQVIVVPGETDCHNSPEFPSLALPVAMLIGVVGGVQYIKSKKE
jgi:hypothetical protein